jgi:hypothetical protein
LDVQTASGECFVKTSNGTATNIFGIDSSNRGTIGTTAASSLVLNTNDQARILIDSSGNVGIGRTPFTSPTGYPLQLRGSSQVFLQMSTSGQGDTATDGLSIGADGTRAYIIQRENAPIAIHTNNSERMRIDSSGRLLVGTTTEGQANADNLTIADSGTCGITLRSASNNFGRIYFSDGTSGDAEYRGIIQYDHSNDRMQFATNASAAMTIDSSGRLGLGTSTAEEILHIKGPSETPGDRDGVMLQHSTAASTADTGLPIVWSGYGSPTLTNYTFASICGRKENGTSGDFSGYLQFATGSSSGSVTEKARIDSSGRLGVGVSSPGYLVDIRGAQDDTTNFLFNGLNVVNTTNQTAVSNKTAIRLATTSDSGVRAAKIIAFEDGSNTFNIGLGFDVNSTNAADSTTRALTIKSSGNVGIGTTSPSQRLNLNIGGDQTWLQIDKSRASDEAMLQLVHTATNRGSRIRYANADSSWTVGIDGSESFVFTSGEDSVGAGGTERARIDSSGRLLVGTSSALTGGGTQFGKFVLLGNSSGANSSGIVVIGRNAAATSLVAGNTVGEIYFGDTAAAHFASISCAADASTGSGDYPGRLVFSTTADGASSPTERMRITNDGKVGIGTTDPEQLLTVNGGFGINNGGGGGGSEIFSVTNASGNPLINATSNATALTFGYSGTEKARIDSSGRLLVGTSSSLSVGEPGNALVQVIGRAGGATDVGRFAIARGEAATSITSSEEIGKIYFTDNAGNTFGQIECTADANAGSGDYPGRLVFSTTADGASSPTEQMRINRNGIVFIYTAYTYNATGTTRDVYVEAGGAIGFVSSVREHKTNITNLENIDWLYNLNPVEFNRRKRDEDLNYLDEYYPEKEYGLIADEVESVQPEMCFYDELEDGTQKLAGVHYRQLIAPMLKALQQANERIETLEAKVAALEAS